MFLRNNYRPAFASASPVDKPSKTAKGYDGIMFGSSETDDFRSFSSSGYSKEPRRSQKPPRRTMTLEVSGRSIAIAIASILAVILVIILAVILLTSGSDNIEYRNNAFSSYKTIDGSYRVSMNGKVMSTVFENEVELTPAKDNSFAYVVTEVGEKENVYILDGGKLKLELEGVDDVLALADFAPGIVYSMGGRIEYSYDDTTVSLARNNDSTPKNFVISPDGSAMAYTIKNKNDQSIDDLYIYTSKQSAPEARSSGKASTIPVSVSNGGEFIVAYAINGDAKELYLVVENERHKINDVNGIFNEITYQNADGSEILFTTLVGKEYHSYIYNCNKMKKKSNSAFDLGAGFSVPQIDDPSIACLETLKECYYQNITNEISFYVNKKYETNAIATYLGVFDPDMKYLYFINDEREVLVQLEVNKGEGEAASSIATDVKDFVITQKGNIYYIDGYGDLYFYKMSKAKPDRITSDVTKLNFYDCANDLYFEKIDSVEATGTYKTSEGSDHEDFEFGKQKLKTLPIFTNKYSKKTYAYYYNEEKDNYILFYSSNGRSFKKIAECEKIDQTHASELQEKIDDLLS